MLSVEEVKIGQAKFCTSSTLVLETLLSFFNMVNKFAQETQNRSSTIIVRPSFKIFKKSLESCIKIDLMKQCFIP